MKNENFEILLKKEIKKVKLESPSDDFLFNVMRMCYQIENELSRTQLFYIWFKKSIPYILTIFIFVIVTGILLLTGTSIEPSIITDFFTNHGLDFFNVLATIKMKFLGVLIGIGVFILLIVNKIKQPKLEYQVL